MPKTKISEFSATPANNTDIDSINIAEGCAPSGINDALRELMAQLKDFQTGAVGDSFNGPVGTSTAAAGAFTTLSASSTATLSGLTASTALALDASKNIVSVTNTGTGSNVLATSPTLVTPILGTPTSATLTNATGLPIATGVSGLGTGVATFLATPSSDNLRSALTDETGTGSAVFATSPTLVTPVLGVATGTSFQGIIGNVTPAAGSFTTLGASSTATLNTLASSGATLTGGTINGMTVGATTPAVGTFTTLAANSEAIATQLTLGGVVASGVATGIALRTGSTKTAWLVGAQFNANNAFEISPSTAAGGTTFNTPAFLIDSSSNVGIGTTSPASKLDVSGGMRAVSSAPSIPASGAGLEIYYASGTFTGTPSAYLISYDRTSAAYKPFNFDGSNYIFRTSGTASLTLDSSGNLGLGVTPSAWGSGQTALQFGAFGALWHNSGFTRVASNVYDNGSNVFYLNTAAASYFQQNAGAFAWFNAPSGTAGNPISFTQAMTLDASGALLLGTTSANPANANGVIAFGGSDAGIIYLERQTGTDQLRFYTGGNRLGYVNTASSTLTIGTANYPLAFSTNDTERARIDSSGFFKTRANGGAYFGGSSNQILNNNNTSGEVCLLIGNAVGSATNNTSSYSLIVSDTGGDRLYVYGNGNVVNINNSYGTLSDVKLKENIVDATPKLDDVMRLQVRNFNLKSNPELKQIGFVAQELEQIFPALIDESPDRDAEGNITEEMTKSIKTSVLVPILVKAIQEQQAIIESLKARLDAANL